LSQGISHWWESQALKKKAPEVFTLWNQWLSQCKVVMAKRKNSKILHYTISHINSNNATIWQTYPGELRDLADRGADEFVMAKRKNSKILHYTISHINSNNATIWQTYPGELRDLADRGADEFATEHDIVEENGKITTRLRKFALLIQNVSSNGHQISPHGICSVIHDCQS